MKLRPQARHKKRWRGLSSERSAVGAVVVQPLRFVSRLPHRGQRTRRFFHPRAPYPVVYRMATAKRARGLGFRASYRPTQSDAARNRGEPVFNRRQVVNFRPSLTLHRKLALRPKADSGIAWGLLHRGGCRISKAFFSAHPPHHRQHFDYDVLIRLGGESHEKLNSSPNSPGGSNLEAPRLLRSIRAVDHLAPACDRLSLQRIAKDRLFFVACLVVASAARRNPSLVLVLGRQRRCRHAWSTSCSKERSGRKVGPRRGQEIGRLSLQQGARTSVA